MSVINIQLRFLINCQISQLVENDQQSFFHLCSLFSCVLWISSKRASSTTTLTAFYGFDVKTKHLFPGYTERLLKLLWWEKRTCWPGFKSSLSKLASRFSFPKLPSLGVILGGWCIQSCVCCSQSVLNVKYYWAPFYQMEYSVLLISDRIQFLGAILVSVTCIEGQSLFNDVSSLQFLFSHLCIPSVWIQIPKETHVQGVHLDLAPFMTAKYVWQWELLVELLDWEKARCGSEMVPSTGWEILIAIRKSLLVTPSSALWISRYGSQAFLCHWINGND